MTITLPIDPVLFENELDWACKKILEYESETMFWFRFAQLINDLREHPLLKDYFLNLEDENEKRRVSFNSAAFEVLEEIWISLWKNNRHLLKNRKKLIYIKRIITNPTEISFSPLYERILFSIREFICLATEHPGGPPIQETNLSLFSSKINAIEQKFFVQGKTDDEK